MLGPTIVVMPDMTGRNVADRLIEELKAEREPRKKLERAMGIEPTTFCLGSRHSTTELRPLG